MKKITIMMLLAISFWLIATVALADPMVFIVGGYESETSYLEDVHAAFPGSKIITPRKYVPIKSAAVVLLEEMKKEEWEVSQDVVFIAYSWSGLLVRQLVKDNPEIKARIILVGTPCRSYWFLPEFLFRIEDERKDVPIFVIAGTKSSEKWFLRDGEPNDGVVEVSSALSVKASAVAIFPLEHSDLLHSEETIEQMKTWATMPLPTVIAVLSR